MQVTLTPATEQVLTGKYGATPELLSKLVASAVLSMEKNSLAADLRRECRPFDAHTRLDALNALERETHELWGWGWQPDQYRIIENRLCWGSRLQSGHMAWTTVGDSTPICTDLLPTG